MKARLVAALALCAALLMTAAPAAAFQTGTSVTVPVGTAPVGVAVAPLTGDRAYVAVSGEDKLVSYPVSGGAAVDIPVGDGPMGVALSPDGTKAYVPSYNDDLVSVIDTTTDTVSGTIPVGSSPFFIATSPDGTKAYVVNSGSGGSVSVIDIITDTVVTTIAFGTGAPVAVAFTPDGSRAYVADSTDDVYVIDVATSTHVDTLPLAGMPYGVGVSTDGTRLFVSQYAGGTVTVFETAGNSVVETLIVGIGAEGVGIRPGGRQVFVAHASGEVAVIDTATLTVVDQIGVGSQPRITAFTADGSRALVSNTGDDSVTMIDLDYTVVFDSAGGSAVAAQDVAKGALPTEPTPPTRAGYLFDGWWDINGEWDFATDAVTAEVDLTAHWLALPTISGPASASSEAGQSFSWTPTISAQPGYTVTSTALPAGLTLDSGTGAITGSPTIATGPVTVTVTVTDSVSSAQTDVAITIEHSGAHSLGITASDLTPRQGDTITITTTATDLYGNSWDASSTAHISSSVPSDRILGNQVTFRHASPHVLTVTVGQATGSITVQVSPTDALGVTGGGIAWGLIPLAASLLLAGGLLIVLRARRVRAAGAVA